MGVCYGKPIPVLEETLTTPPPDPPTADVPPPVGTTPKPWKLPFYSPSPILLYKSSPATPMRIFKWPFPPPSPAKHIKALLARRHGAAVKPNEASIPEGDEGGRVGLDCSFGFSRQFSVRYELEEEVGRGHFGYTRSARAKKGDMKGEEVAVKVIHP